MNIYISYLGEIVSHEKYMNTNLKGNIIELEVQLLFIKNGYDIFIPVGDGNKIDLIIIKKILHYQ